MSQPLFGELDLLHSNQGVLIGTAGLVVLWITLTLLERRGRRVGALVSRTVKRPLTLGLAVALYAGWITQLLEPATSKLNGLASARLSASLMIVAISWAAIRLGHAVLRSRSFEEWLKVEDPKDEAMLISLLDRLYVIGVLVVASAALMVMQPQSQHACRRLMRLERGRRATVTVAHSHTFDSLTMTDVGSQAGLDSLGVWRNE